MATNLKAKVLALMDTIIPPDEYANEIACQPSWLLMPDGRRASIDIFYPGLPLAISIRGSMPRLSSRRRKQQIVAEQEFLDERLFEEPLRCPHLVFDERSELTTSMVLDKLQVICRIYPDARVEGLRQYAYGNSA